MMVNCPKCGFSQPQDRYCASCGIDMISFKPAQKPFATRLLTSTGFQVVGLSLAVIAIAFFVRGKNDAEFARQQQELAQSQSLASAYTDESEQARTAANAYADQVAAESQTSRERAAANAEAEARLQEEASAQMEAEQRNANSQGVQTASFASTAPTTASTNAPTGTPTAASPSSAANAAVSSENAAKAVSIYFLEMPRASANALLREAKQSATDGITSFGVITEAQKTLARVRGVRTLDGAENQALRLNQPNMVFKGTRDTASGQNLGFTIQAVPVLSDENGTHLQIDANRSLRDPNSGLDSFNFALPDSFTVPKRGAVVIMGLLPHRALFEGEQLLYRNSNVLRIMSSPQFRQGVTDLAIVIETK